MKKISIGIIVDDITVNAGTERAVSNISNGLLKYYPESYNITIISRFSKKNNDSYFYFNPLVKIEHLETKNEFKSWKKFFLYISFIRLIRKINKKNKFDLLIGTTYVQNNLLPIFVKNTRTKTMACEHVVYDYPPKLIKRIRKIIYPKLDSVIVLNEKEYHNFNFLNNVTIIPNSLPFEPKIPTNLNQKRIIAVGRLTYEKGFDMLIDIYEKIYKEADDWNLMIFGEGDEYKTLDMKIKSKGLEKHIKLCGSEKNISKRYLESSILVLSSRWESFGMVIIEAMSHGIPVVSFDCDGPESIIIDNNNGFLIPRFDKSIFSEKLLYLIKDFHKRKTMGSNAIKTSHKYKETNIIPLWNKQIKSLIRI